MPGPLNPVAHAVLGDGLVLVVGRIRRGVDDAERKGNYQGEEDDEEERVVGVPLPPVIVVVVVVVRRRWHALRGLDRRWRRGWRCWREVVVKYGPQNDGRGRRVD